MGEVQESKPQTPKNDESAAKQPKPEPIQPTEPTMELDQDDEWEKVVSFDKEEDGMWEKVTPPRQHQSVDDDDEEWEMVTTVRVLGKKEKKKPTPISAEDKWDNVNTEMKKKLEKRRLMEQADEEEEQKARSSVEEQKALRSVEEKNVRSSVEEMPRSF